MIALNLKRNDVQELSAGPVYNRPLAQAAILACQDFGSTIHADNVKFQINLDCCTDILVKAVDQASDNSIIIEGNTSRSRTIMATYISQYFIQRYSLPPELDFNQINSSISSHGILTISAPKRAVADAEGHKSIPIVQTVARPSDPNNVYLLRVRTRPASTNDHHHELNNYVQQQQQEQHDLTAATEVVRKR
nr:protein lethal(2)essential for life-like [Aedes albopictus]